MDWTKVVISAISAALVAGGGAVLAVLTALPGGDSIPQSTWVIGSLTAAVAFGNDIRSGMSLPPATTATSTTTKITTTPPA